MFGVKWIPKTRHYLYRSLTGFMVIWLAVFYSAICEYHGLMLPLNHNSTWQMAQSSDDAPVSMPMDAMPMGSMAMMSPGMHHVGMGMQMSNWAFATCKVQADKTMLQLGRMALNTVALSFLTISAPAACHVHWVQQQSLLLLVDLSIAHQCKVAPLDPPPRFEPL